MAQHQFNHGCQAQTVDTQGCVDLGMISQQCHHGVMPLSSRPRLTVSMIALPPYSLHITNVLLNAIPETPVRQPTFDYDSFYDRIIAVKKSNQSYRYFNNINRLAQAFPQAHMSSKEQKVTVWCSNDYLGMGRNPHVIDKMHDTLDMYGSTAGGTRNISGHNQHAEALEKAVARLHHKEAGLVFTSCFVANDATLSTLGSGLVNCTILSDSKNHASMIEGIRHSKARKMIFAHNDMQDLEAKLASLPREDPKIIAFESVYSMSGSIGKIERTCDLAERYGAITFLDEVHATGMYGPTGAGVAEHLDFEAHLNGRHRGTVMDRVDIISSTLGKAYGCMGGYIAGKASMIDVVRSLAPGFIFTTSLPPAVMAGALVAIEYQQKRLNDRVQQQLHTRAVKNALMNIDIPFVPNPSHIIPVFVGNAGLARAASDMLLLNHQIYVQAINYPTVPVGEECLRITPTPGHTNMYQEHLIAALNDVWHRLGIKRASDWVLQGGMLGVKDGLAEEVAPLWTDEQLGLMTPNGDSTIERPTPKTGAVLGQEFPEAPMAKRASA